MTGSPKVLLVDDEAEVRRSTVQMLELADVGVRDFASAEEVRRGLTAIKACLYEQ